MRVVIFVVNYHTDDHVLRLLESVSGAWGLVREQAIDVHVLDNSARNETGNGAWRRRLRESEVPATLHQSATNAGYFGNLGLAQRLTDDATAVIYCNPDIVLDPTFFAELAKIGDVGVIAPAIVSIADGFDQNPKYESRLSAAKLRRLERIYSNGLLFSAYGVAGRAKELFASHRRNGSRSAGLPRPIYAPHGAMFVFTDIPFFRALPPYPCFLFGEELFVAEEARLAGVPVIYRPELRVHDVRHAAVSALPRSRLRSLMRESVVHILAEYYAEGARTRE
jgi:hypothetical protein